MTFLFIHLKISRSHDYTRKIRNRKQSSYQALLASYSEKIQTILELKESRQELIDTLENALNIVDLWAPDYSKDEIRESDIGELAALSMMRQSMEKTLIKAKKL